MSSCPGSRRLHAWALTWTCIEGKSPSPTLANPTSDAVSPLKTPSAEGLSTVPLHFSTDKMACNPGALAPVERVDWRQKNSIVRAPLHFAAWTRCREGSPLCPRLFGCHYSSSLHWHQPQLPKCTGSQVGGSQPQQRQRFSSFSSVTYHRCWGSFPTATSSPASSALTQRLSMLDVHGVFHNISLLIVRHRNISCTTEWISFFLLSNLEKLRWADEGSRTRNPQGSQADRAILRSLGGCFSSEMGLPGPFFLWPEGYRKKLASLIRLHLCTLHQARH